MIKTAAFLVCLCLVCTAAAVQAGERPILAELFTSEGCSSCPPADALLTELATRPDVLALSFHVDYWDRLGWKDPFSSTAATERQERYAQLLRLATVYTPQIVVEGKWQAVGSDRAEVERALDMARRSPSELSVALAVARGSAQIKLGPAPAPAPVSGVILLIGFDRRHVSAVARGENSGRSLAHADVVRGIAEVGQFSGGATALDVPIGWQCDRVAAIVQARSGEILGAAVADMEPR